MKPSLSLAIKGFLPSEKSILDSEGIPWFAAGEQTQMLSVYHAPLQFVELHVLAEHAARAKELLQHLTNENAQDA